MVFQQTPEERTILTSDLYFLPAKVDVLAGSSSQIDESHMHDIYNILKESYAHEQKALSLYKELLETVEGASIYIEEYARQMIGQEEMHTLELAKMLRDFEPTQ